MEQLSAAEVGVRFGYTAAVVHQMASQLRAGKGEFFASSKPGPKGPRKAARIRDRVLELRASERSVTEIAQALTAAGTPVSAQTVWGILAAEGLERLERRPVAERGAPAARLEPVKVRAIPAWPAGISLPCDHAGLFLLVPGIVELGLHDLVDSCGYPHTKVLSAWHSLGTLLLAKCARKARVSHTDALADDDALGLLLGLTALPKATHLTSYSYRVRRAANEQLLTGLTRRLRELGLATGAAFAATTANTSTLSAAADWTAPSITASAIAPTSGGPVDHVKPGGSCYVYANVADTGNPAAGTQTVTADASGLTAGQDSVALTAGSYTLGGASYNYRSAALTADSNTALSACRYSYPITATDSASPANSATKTGQKAIVDRDLLGDYNIRLDGDRTGGATGYSVAAAGDVNGDGRPDAILGAHQMTNTAARLEAGAAYVIFGQATTTTVDLASLGSGGFRIDGAAAADNAGVSVAGAGDVNSDGNADVLVGAHGADGNSGWTFVVFGKADSATVDLAALGSQGYRIDGKAGYDRAGFSVAGAGDVNGDGKADVLVGAYAADNNSRTGSGSAYVVFGKTDTATVDLGALGANGYRIDGAAAGNAAGYSVAGAGDVNGDAIPDQLVGAHLADNNGRTNSGSAYVVFGKAGTATVDLNAMGGRGYRIDGAAAGDYAGISVAGAGDIDGDGRRDLLVLGRNADNSGADTRAARPDRGWRPGSRS